MRTDGWEDSESYRGLYEFITGWDAKEKQVFSWAFGGYPTDFGIIRRAGQYDPAERAFNGRESFVRFAGEEESARVVDSRGYHGVRTIEYGEAAKTITAREEGATATGDVLSYDQWQRPIDAKSFEWHATKVIVALQPWR